MTKIYIFLRMYTFQQSFHAYSNNWQSKYRISLSDSLIWICYIIVIFSMLTNTQHRYSHISKPKPPQKPSPWNPSRLVRRVYIYISETMSTLWHRVSACCWPCLCGTIVSLSRPRRLSQENMFPFTRSVLSYVRLLSGPHVVLLLNRH